MLTPCRNVWCVRRCFAQTACSWRHIPKFWNWMRALKIEKETRMYGTCETLCRELAAKYPGDTPMMLVVWSPEEIQALADGMEISLTDHEIRTVLARLEDIPEDQRIESGISSGAAMEIISNVSENRQVSVPVELLASLIQTAEQALWKREWAARDNGLTVPECVTRRQAVVNQARSLLKNNTHENN
ncbi:DUF1380 domain-containing protein [Shigella sonnei]|nr:DUF1380 domain-containing protein [Salmonella enterica]EHD6896410.1 DUF1380 domain-containing protein [Shigella sonnei]EBN7960543.1 DUF1380 domain-containing protein [Salmonella enterica]ECZ1643510.1 DUF1380 domain-containing protein [Salmonella enterica]EHJ4118751.1 DUF1380 domain-containing protein [Shigella sonnei]